MKNDAAYNNRDHIPGADAYPDRWAEEARAHRETEASLGRARLNVSYGSHARERFDLFHPSGQPKGLAVFVHGGYWRLFDRDFWSHFATGLTARDWAVAMPSYPLAPEVGIDRITRAVSAAIAQAASYVAGPIALAGHSAGGHLVARMATGTSGLPSDVTDRIRAIAPISPLSDLRPLLETSMNEDFRMDEDDAMAESPALLDKSLDVPVRIFVGGDERPAFLDQARWLAEAWPDTTSTIVEGRHHFDVIDGLRDPGGEIVAALVD